MRKLQGLANNSAQAEKLLQFQRIADNYSGQNLQKKSNGDKVYHLGVNDRSHVAQLKKTQLPGDPSDKQNFILKFRDIVKQNLIKGFKGNNGELLQLLWNESNDVYEANKAKGLSLWNKLTASIASYTNELTKPNLINTNTDKRTTYDANFAKSYESSHFVHESGYQVTSTSNVGNETYENSIDLDHGSIVAYSNYSHDVNENDWTAIPRSKELLDSRGRIA